MATPLIIQYTNLLHKYGDPTASPVKAFLEENSQDEAFLRRAKVLNKVFELKRQLVNP
jgi:hypothetical protein